ncbi:hypothetical protein [Cytobacillus massiliigabonensis]|uniref:hypothetical protein n=1 Tax=Cytobacillus massiliigabonensis TaxID=1871011 RepID=UPI000C8594C1|nr:hypothetical protein [Cytobacillus massiliigabonensis]
MKLMKWIFISTLVLFLAAACSKDKEESTKEVTAEAKEDESEKEQKKEKQQEETEEKAAEAKEDAEVYVAEQTFEEIAFQNVNWFFGSPERQPKGGIWVFTAEKHAGELKETFDWEKEDVLLVQVNDPAYVNHAMTIKGLQIVDDKTVKIVVSLEAEETESDKVPRRYVTVEKNSLTGKNFLLEDEKTGEAIKLN